MFLRAAGVIFWGCATLTAIRLAVAETISHEDTPEAIRQALTLQWPTPSAELYQRLAELDPEHALELLKNAVEANPRFSSSWIALGLSAEASGNHDEAEHSLLQAAHIDRQYLPAWTLTNFYFRQADREQFWQWADRALALDYDDFKPLLQLCDRFERDPSRLLAHFHDMRRIQTPYLNFLIGENRLDAAQRVAQKMMQQRENDPHLIDLADRQLRAGNVPAAIELWNAASGFPPIEPLGSKILTNGDLAHSPTNLGFDWHLGRSAGVTETWKPFQLIFAFSGSQANTCVLMSQSIYLIPGHFQLRFDYLTPLPAVGIRWSLEQIEGPPLEPDSQWKESFFDLPRVKGLRNLQLFYRRDSGTVRTEGRIEIRNLRLETIP